MRSMLMRLGTPRLPHGTRYPGVHDLYKRLEIKGRPAHHSSRWRREVQKPSSPARTSGSEFTRAKLQIKQQGSETSSHTALMACVFAPGAYHGGMNSIYHVGYSPLGREVLDADLAGAYSTSLAAIFMARLEQFS